MTAGTPDDSEGASKATLMLPLALVACLLGLLFVALRTGDPAQLPSALVGKPVPNFDLPAVPKLLGDFGPVKGLSSAELHRGKVSVLNIWASWCAPCRVEHPELVELARLGVPLYAIDYKDTPEAARRFLAQLGNPFRAIGADEDGMTAIDFGVYGVPETFVVDGEGRIRFRHPGPLTPDVVKKRLMPAIEAARQNRLP